MFKVKSNHSVTEEGNSKRSRKSSCKKKSNSDDHKSSSMHSRNNKTKSSNKIRVSDIEALLEKHANNSVTTTPLDEVSVSSALSDSSSFSITSRTSQVSTLSKLPSSRRLGRSGSTRTFGRQSSHRSIVSHNSSTCGSILQPDNSNMALDANHIVMVTGLWQQVKQVDTFAEDMPEQCILRMLELDPQTRTNLRLPSMRSPRYDVISATLLRILEDLIPVLGPDVDDFIEELCAVGELCAQEGINSKLLGEATAAGLAMLLGDSVFGPTEMQVWKMTFDFLATKMNGHADFGF